jgi:hypothetical protein
VRRRTHTILTQNCKLTIERSQGMPQQPERKTSTEREDEIARLQLLIIEQQLYLAQKTAQSEWSALKSTSSDDTPPSESSVGSRMSSMRAWKSAAAWNRSPTDVSGGQTAATPRVQTHEHGAGLPSARRASESDLPKSEASLGERPSERRSLESAPPQQDGAGQSVLLHRMLDNQQAPARTPASVNRRSGNDDSSGHTSPMIPPGTPLARGSPEKSSANGQTKDKPVNSVRKSMMRTWASAAAIFSKPWAGQTARDMHDEHSENGHSNGASGETISKSVLRRSVSNASLSSLSSLSQSSPAENGHTNGTSGKTMKKSVLRKSVSTTPPSSNPPSSSTSPEPRSSPTLRKSVSFRMAKLHDGRSPQKGSFREARR